MPLHQGGMKTGQLIMLFLIFASWVIMLSGLGRVQDMCNSGGFNPTSSEFPQDLGLRVARGYARDGHLIPLSVPGIRPWTAVPGNDGTGGGRDDKCGILFSWDWWTVMFQFFLIMFSLMGIINETFHSLKHTIIAFYVIAIFQSTVFTSIFTKYTYAFNGGNHSDDAVGQGSAVAVVGGIAVTIFNYVFIWLFGSSEEGFTTPEEAEPEPQVKVDTDYSKGDLTRGDSGQPALPTPPPISPQANGGAAAAPSSSNDPPALIKGNINGQTNEKIYHVPGGSYYNRTKIDPARGEKYFTSEEEALKEGFRPAAN